MIGILCATPEEIAAVRARLDLDGGARDARADPGLDAVRHEGQSPWCWPRPASARSTRPRRPPCCSSVFGARALIFSGVAGGLDPALPVGSVLLADRLAIHDYGVMAGGRLTPDGQSGLDPAGAPRLTALTPVPAAVAADAGAPGRRCCAAGSRRPCAWAASSPPTTS